MTLVKLTNNLLMASGFHSLIPSWLKICFCTAFNIVDHSLLLKWLERVFGVSGTDLKWFIPYFTDLSQFISMSGHRSEIGSVFSGVPQGSVSGPLYFNICHHLVISWASIIFCLLAQIYMHSKLDEHSDMAFLSDCITEIKT